MTRGLLILFLVAAAMNAQPARADSRAVILPPRVDEGLPDTVADQVAEVVAEHLRTDLNMQVTPPVTAQSAAPANAADCWTTACALAYKKPLLADFAVVVTLQAHGGRLARLMIALVVDHDIEYVSADAIAEGPELERVVVRVLQAALKKKERGPGPWIDVVSDETGSAMDAAVEIDGKRVGQVPYRDQIRSGDHYIVVRKEGFRPLKKTVGIAAGAGSETELVVGLEPGGPSHGPGMWKNHLLGFTFVVGGVALGATRATRNLLLLGDCTGSTCTTEYAWDQRNWAYIAGGLVTVGLGSYIAWGVRPFTVTAAADDSSASVAVQGSF